MAINFEVVGASSPSKVVRLQLQPDDAGDVALLVNGKIMLWIMSAGYVCLENDSDSARVFKGLGFEITHVDEVKVV